jgi:hypothetical protein
MSWDLSRGGPTHDEIGLGHPGVSFTSPKSLVPSIYIYKYIYIYLFKKTYNPLKEIALSTHNSKWPRWNACELELRIVFVSLDQEMTKWKPKRQPSTHRMHTFSHGLGLGWELS